PMEFRTGSGNPLPGPSASDTAARPRRRAPGGGSTGPPPSPSGAEDLGTRCPHHHRVGDVMALDAEERNVERLAVIPVMALQASMSPAPGTDARACDQAQPLTQRRRVARRPRADPTRFQAVEADLEVSLKAGPQGTMPVASAFPHGWSPVRGRLDHHPYSTM